ncbi:MAG: J domain-containing protein [Lentisphaeria bacterium]|nr:J domain-containing protein [Lentisphaeria bacterium]
MPPGPPTFYDLLGVSRTCSFPVLKRAYYRRAKQCHPDLHGGDARREEEFKQLVAAFDVLSDPRRRREYNLRLAQAEAPSTPTAFREEGPSIMDTLADDTLEEMVVGNTIPRNTTLQTLMLDLTRTKRFIAFREARNLFTQREYRKAGRICRRLVHVSPQNILYRFTLAECYRCVGFRGRARHHYRRCLITGLERTPPQALRHIRRRLAELLDEQGAWGRVMGWFVPPLPPGEAPQEDATAQLRRHFLRALRRRSRYDRALLPSPRRPPEALPPHTDRG